MLLPESRTCDQMAIQAQLLSRTQWMPRAVLGVAAAQPNLGVEACQRHDLWLSQHGLFRKTIE